MRSSWIQTGAEDRAVASAATEADDPSRRLNSSLRDYFKQMPQFPEDQTENGEFERQEDAFREFIKAVQSSMYPAASGRYHLYISLACPWASRTLIVRNLKGPQDIIGVTVVDPFRDERGWAFRDGPGDSEDPINVLFRAKPTSPRSKV